MHNIQKIMSVTNPVTVTNPVLFSLLYAVGTSNKIFTADTLNNLAGSLASYVRCT